MSQTDLGRALEFMRQPQEVEVRREGTWFLGSMIGWRREAGGSCRVMVRVAQGGQEKTAWADLCDVRLPEEEEPFPSTASLPFVPRLPSGPAEEEAGVATGARRDQWQTGSVSERVPGWSSPDSAAGRGGGSDRTAHDVEVPTGRHRAHAGEGPVENYVYEYEAADSLAWLTDSLGPSAFPPEPEPTRLLTLRRPRQM